MNTTSLTARARLMSGAAIGAVALLAFGGAAQAQTAPQPVDPQEEEAVVDEIIVTGIRASIASSIAAKARNTSIVEVITAEDIGKLPDVSIAESLARLPGLTAQRLDGRSQAISIRGLGPDFTTALLNGREQVTTGDNRGVEFDQYPSELLSGVTVYKTPDAQLIGQGLGGTVDLQTVRPLAYGRQAIALNYRYEQNDIGALNSGTGDTGNRYSISFIDQFADDTIGVALGYAHIESPYQSERYNAWGYPTLDIGNDLYGEPVPGSTTGARRARAGYQEEAGALILGGLKPYVMSSELERDGFMGVVEWKPNDRFSTTVDAFYSEFQNYQVLRGIEFPLYWGGSSGACPSAADNPAPPQTATCRPSPRLQPNAVVENGLITAGTFTNVKGVVRNDVNTRDSEIFAFGWNTEFRATEDLTLELDVNTSRVERTDVVLETYSGTGRDINGALDTLDFVLDGNGVPTFTSRLNYADPNLIRITSPQGWGGDIVPGGQDGYLNSPTIEDEIRAVRLSGRLDLHQSPFSAIEIGANISEREKSFVADEFYLAAAGDTTIIPAAFLLEPTALGYLGIPAVISYDALGLVNSGFFGQTRNPNFDVVSKDWIVNEKVNTFWIKADIDHNLFGLPLTGNVGLQIVDTDQSSTGFASSATLTGTATVPVEGGDQYVEFLPSSNFILEVGEDQFVRFAYARTLARPRLDDMRASRTFNFNVANNTPTATPTQNSPWSGGGGNPELRPYIADVFDISYEKYFANRTGYVSLAAFHKELETYVYNRNQVFDFTGFPTGGITPVTNFGLVGAPDNGEGGYIRGLEFSLSVPFDIVHPWLDGFGMQFSASQTESEVSPDPGQGAPTPLPGLSETVGNLTVYYEKNGFQARVSNRYRSDFLGEVAGFGNGRTLRSVAAENVVDAQIGYEFQSGLLEGTSVLFQVNNLTDEPFQTFENDDERRIIDYQAYGRTFLAGINYRF